MKSTGLMKAVTAAGKILIATMIVASSSFAQDRNQAMLPAATSSKKIQLLNALDNLPLSFEANQGQVDSSVKFLSRGPAHTLFLTSTEAVLSVPKREDEETNSTRPQQTKNESFLLRMKLLGADPHAEVTGVDRLSGESNYFIGKDPAKWHAEIPTYSKVRYRQIYRGVDLVYYGNRSELEYDFIVAPGADARQIRLRFDGAKKLFIDAQADAVLSTGAGQIRLRRPHLYQETAGKRTDVEGGFALRGHELRFDVGQYDRRRALVIDPQLSYSTYLGGGNGVDQGIAIAVDTAGNAYVAGTTTSPNFPTTGGSWEATPDLNVAAGDIFITKLNPAGSSLVYSTYLGGLNIDRVKGLALDSSGNAYVTGLTTSDTFPITPGALQASYQTAFVTKLNASGSALVYSTYLGGCGGANANGIAVDSAGSAYVAGSVNLNVDPCYPTTVGAFQRTNLDPSAPQPGFVSKLDPTGRFLVYSTFVNGANVEAIAVDSAGNAYLTGQVVFSGRVFTTTPGAFLTAPTGDIFVSALNPAGSGLIYSTYIGGGGGHGHAIAVDSNGNAYFTGESDGSYPTTPGTFQTTPPSQFGGAFVTELNSTGSALIYSTFIGGDGGSGIALDSSANAYVTGTVSLPTLSPTPDALQFQLLGSSDAFVTVVNPTGSSLVYSTYLGGNGIEQGGGIAADSAGNVYVTGQTGSSDFPVTPGAFQTSKAPNSANAFVSKLSGFAGFNTPASSPPGTPVVVSPNGNVTVTFSNVNQAGQTTATNIGGSCPAAPVDFQLGGACYDISTTAQYTGSVQVCISDPSITSSSTLMHYQGGWTDITTSINAFTQTICGTAQSLSPFAIFQRTQFPLTITPNPVSRQYGSPDPTPFQVSYSGLVNGDSPTSLSGQLMCISSDGAASPVGAYTIDCSSSTLSSPKYVITYKTGTLTITPAPLTLSADNQRKTYGGSLPALTFSVSGFVNGDTKASLTTQPTLSTTATTASGVGVYAITISGAVDPNYTISYVPGTLIISPAVLTITAPITSKVLNSPNPTFTPTANGFVNGDTASVLTSVPSCATTALTTSAVGSYAITCSGGNAANYTFNYIPGTLKIVYSTTVGHMIQPPISSNGSSVFNQGRTIPAKFNVYDANGVSIGTPGVISSFYLTGILSGTMTTPVQDVVDTNNPDAAFRWDSTAQQWVFNITTGNLVPGSTYVYTIALNDGSSIEFQFGLR